MNVSHWAAKNDGWKGDWSDIILFYFSKIPPLQYQVGHSLMDTTFADDVYSKCLVGNIVQ